MSGQQSKHGHRHANSRVDEPWQELLGALFSASQSEDSGQRETAFRIFATTPDIIQRQHEDIALGAFQKGFRDSVLSV